jgi:hypothetical protein
VPGSEHRGHDRAALSGAGTDAPEVKKLEKEWAKYRKEHGLDLYGKPEDSAVDAPGHDVQH